MFGLGQGIVAAVAPRIVGTTNWTTAAQAVLVQIESGRVSGDLRAWIAFWAPAVESARSGRNLYALSAQINRFLTQVTRPHEMQQGLVTLSAMLHAASRGRAFASGSAGAQSARPVPVYGSIASGAQSARPVPVYGSIASGGKGAAHGIGNYEWD